MSTNLREKEEKILQVLNRLEEESSKGIPIIVEGKKDVQALRELCIPGEVMEAKTGGKSLIEVICEVREGGKKEIILLLDFDRRGRKLTKRLKQHLEKLKIKPNTYFWRRLKAIVGRDVKDIEGLSSYIETLRKKIHGLP